MIERGSEVATAAAARTMAGHVAAAAEEGERQGRGGGAPVAVANEATGRTVAWASSVANEAAGDREGEAIGRNGRGPRDGRRRTRALFNMPTRNIN